MPEITNDPMEVLVDVMKDINLIDLPKNKSKLEEQNQDYGLFEKMKTFLETKGEFPSECHE